MNAKYEVSILLGSKVIAKVKVDKNNKQDKNNMPPIDRCGGIKIPSYAVGIGNNAYLSVISWAGLALENCPGPSVVTDTE